MRVKIAQKHNFFQRRYIFLFVFVFLALYLLFSFCLYLYQSYAYGYLAHKRLLATFVKKHTVALQKEVFQKAFSIGQFCEDSKIESVRTTCYEKVSRLIANSIPEEELASGGYDWPNDLFFVKQEGTTFHRIGWSGKWEDITSTTNDYRLDNNILFSLFPPSANCNYFNSFQTQAGTACEYYEKVTLGKNKTGYLVRQHAITEDDYYILMLILTPFAAFQMQTLFVPQYPDAFFVVITPLLLSILIVFLYARKVKNMPRLATPRVTKARLERM